MPLKEAQHKMYKERRFFDIATEGLTWSWTVLRAAFLFDLAQPSPTVLATMPPEGASSLATTTAGTNPEFTVQFERAPGSSLGLNLDALDGQSLIISAVKNGPVRQHNEKQEDDDMMLQLSS
eukprot:g21047.t3